MIEVVELLTILAKTMLGEATYILDDDAMMAVGHVFMNRYLLPHKSFGDAPSKVVTGFHGYDPDLQVTAHHMDLAWWVVTETMGPYQGLGLDPTHGSLYILSHQDIKKQWPINSQCVMNHAIWRSKLRMIDGTVYRLYAFKHWPTGVMPHEAQLCSGAFYSG